MVTVTVTKEVGSTKSVELRSSGTSRVDVFVDNKKVRNQERKTALQALKADNVKTTTSTKTYDIKTWDLLSDDVKVEGDSYMDLVHEAIKGYRKRNYKY